MMKKYCIIGFVLFLLALVPLKKEPLFAAVVPGRLVSDREAETVGLTRSWFNQVSLSAGKEEVAGVTLQDNALFITTESGFLQAIDALSGTTLWKVQVGSSQFKTFPPAANSRVVAVVNGTTLYLYSREHGKCLLETTVFSQPFAGPQMTERYVLVPLLMQKILAIPLNWTLPEQKNLAKSLKDMAEIRKNITFSDAIEKQISELANAKENTDLLLQPVDLNQVRYCISLGLSLTTPTLASQSLNEDYICWTTNMGWMMIGRLDYKKAIHDFSLLYKIAILPQIMYLDSKRFGQRVPDIKNEIDGSPFFLSKDVTPANLEKVVEKQSGGLLFVGAANGQVLAVNSVTGEVRWKFMTNSPVSEKIMADETYCFVPSDDGTLFCLNTPTGEPIWEASSVKKLLSLSPKSIYAIDFKGNLRMLNRESGRVTGTLPISSYKFQLFNQESDRIFFVSADGLVQCLHEKNLEFPLQRRESSFDIAKRLAEDMAAYMAGKEGELKIRRQDEALQANEVQAPLVPSARVAPVGAQPNANNDPFGEMTGERPKAPEKKKDDANPFGDDEIF